LAFGRTLSSKKRHIHHAHRVCSRAHRRSEKGKLNRKVNSFYLFSCFNSGRIVIVQLNYFITLHLILTWWIKRVIAIPLSEIHMTDD
jgi:hypothetical protein